MALDLDFVTLRWEAQGCAPLVVTGTEVEAARAMLGGGVAFTVMAGTRLAQGLP